MFLRFKEECRDGKTGRQFYLGDIREFADERAKEILSVDGGRYAEVVTVTMKTPEGSTTDESQEEKPKGEDDIEKAETLGKMTKQEIVEIAKRMGLSADGDKTAIIARIIEADGGKDDNGTDRQEL